MQQEGLVRGAALAPATPGNGQKLLKGAEAGENTAPVLDSQRNVEIAERMKTIKRQLNEKSDMSSHQELLCKEGLQDELQRLKETQNPKGALQEIYQERKLTTPRYEPTQQGEQVQGRLSFSCNVIDGDGRIIGRGAGNTRKEAEAQAATDALRRRKSVSGRGIRAQHLSALNLDDSSLTEENVNAEYRRLAAVSHPDKGGSAEAFSALNDARDFLLAECSAATRLPSMDDAAGVCGVVGPVRCLPWGIARALTAPTAYKQREETVRFAWHALTIAPVHQDEGVPQDVGEGGCFGVLAADPIEQLTPLTVTPFYTGGGSCVVSLMFLRHVSVSYEQARDAFRFHDKLLAHLEGKVREDTCGDGTSAVKRYAVVPRTGDVVCKGGDCDVDWVRCREFNLMTARVGEKRCAATESIRGREGTFTYRKGGLYQRMLIKTHGKCATPFLMLRESAEGSTPRRSFEEANDKFKGRFQGDWRAYYRSKGLEGLDGEQQMVRCVQVVAQDCWEHESSRAEGRLASKCKQEGKSLVSVDPAAPDAGSDVPPELLMPHPLQLSAVILPSVLVAIEADARALDVGRAALDGSSHTVSTSARAEHLLAAMTAPSAMMSLAIEPFPRRCYSVQSNAGNVRALNFERLETVGNGFLKAIASAEVFLHSPALSAGDMTELRKPLVLNERLGGLAVDAGLHLHVNNHRPSLSKWTRGAEPEWTRDVSADVLSHALKALLASFFLGCARDASRTCAPTMVAARWLRLVPTDQPAADRLIQFMCKGGDSGVSDVSAETSRDDDAVLEMVEVAIGYKFKNRKLLRTAITPRSVSACDNYERLEFLGDGVLEALVARELYWAHPDDSVEQLCLKRIAIVEHKGLCIAAVRNQLHRALLAGLWRDQPSALMLRGYLRQHFPAELVGLIDNDAARADVTSEAEAPKTLSDVCEAVLGAVMVDSGLDTACRVGWHMVQPVFASE